MGVAHGLKAGAIIAASACADAPNARKRAFGPQLRAMLCAIVA